MEGMMQQVVENQLMQVAKVVEDQLDDQIHELENLGDEDIEKLRQRRIDAMKRQQAKRQQWLAKGHGECRTIMDEKEFFAEMKGEERMIVHFFRNNWPCKVMDKHMSELAAKHVETKFARIDAEKSPFLTERLKIWMLPTLALIKNEKTVDYVVGLDELGGSDDFKQVPLPPLTLNPKPPPRRGHLALPLLCSTSTYQAVSAHEIDSQGVPTMRNGSRACTSRLNTASQPGRRGQV